MSYTERERIAHVYRRLGIGSQPDLLEGTDSVEEAISRSITLDGDPPELAVMDPPQNREDATDIATLAVPVRSWLAAMANSPRLIEERLTWFWHDHFATAIQKVRIPYLLWAQHLTIRTHATGHFGELLYAVATDPAMLFYLDGARNHTDAINENFAREVMELHTMGPGNYSQTDVTEVARATSGWVVNVPYAERAKRFLADYEPWSAVFVPVRHDRAAKTVLGRTGPHDMSDIVEILLDQSVTSEFISKKLFMELVGLEPDPTMVTRLADNFRENYSIMTLVDDIVNSPEFVSDNAIRAKVRTPVERLVAIAQALGTGEVDEQVALALHGMAFLPFNPPSPAGFPKGRVLLGPHQLVHSFDLLAAATPSSTYDVESLTLRLGIPDLSDHTRAVLDAATGDGMRMALAVNTPEFALV